MPPSDTLEQTVVENDIKFLTPFIVDLNGVLRGKRLPSTQLNKVVKKGIRMPLSAANVDIWGKDIDDSPLVFQSGDVDGKCIWTEQTPLLMSWNESHSLMLPMSYFNEDGSPFMGDSRNILRSVLQKFAAMSLRVVLGFELEFYLTNPNETDAKVINPLTGNARNHDGVLSIDDINDYTKFLDDVCRCCELNDIDLDAISSESGMSQFEINLRHTDDILKITDSVIFLKNIIKFIARQHGFAATFMAKPFSSRPGSGMHAHFSLLDAKSKNILDDGSEEGSSVMRNCVGGMIRHMRQSALIFAPHLNSYRRLAPNQHAPIKLNWGYENRTAALRIPGGEKISRRIEHRVAGADTNAYLVAAAILGAALVGIKNQIEAPTHTIGDSSVFVREEDTLPTTWLEAINCLKNGDLIGGTINELALDMILRTKKQEYATFMSDISQFEYKSYLEAV